MWYHGIHRHSLSSLISDYRSIGAMQMLSIGYLSIGLQIFPISVRFIGTSSLYSGVRFEVASAL